MILTLLFFIFECRIVFPKIDCCRLLETQKQRMKLVFFMSFFGKIIFGTLIGYDSSKFFLIPFELGIVGVLFFYFRSDNRKKVSKECDRLVQKLEIELQKHKSIYSALKCFLDKSEAFKQHNVLKSFDSVLFAQQKERISSHFKDIEELCDLLFEMKECSHYSFEILKTHKEKKQNSRRIFRKKQSISQNARSQSLACSLLFVGLILFQIKNFSIELLFSYLIISVTIFGIGLLGIYFFMRNYI